MSVNTKFKPLNELRNLSKNVVHEGVVLLKNDNGMLPIVNKKVAVFGRIQTNYYKSGTGSGGLVNVTDVPSWIDAINENPRLDLNKDLSNHYLEWINENPFNAGNGMWASEPWSQVEMPIDVETINRFKRIDEVAIMIIGRTAGEDRDNFSGEGSYKLTKIEEEVLKNIKETYEEVLVILNVGNIIDTNYFVDLNINSILYAWNGGQDGARSTIDVVTGYINPSGKLPDTIFKDLTLYGANEEFGKKARSIYTEDIYVGYRYSETFTPNNVLFPFGFGLSYTNFEIKINNTKVLEDKIELNINVKNTGTTAGKEVVQIYFSAPQGLLGKPKLELLSFAKTNLLEPNESQDILFTLEVNKMASYDDTGLVSLSSYVLEKGSYDIYVGNSVKDLVLATTYELESNNVVETLQQALAPVEAFNRVKPNTNFEVIFEDTPLSKVDLLKRIKDNLPKEIDSNNKNINLLDVYNKKNTLDDFIGSLSFDDLNHIVLGEGMSSPKVTPGTASAFGGVTDSLLDKGVSIACCADGPSGIRMDSGGLASSLPIGTLLASSFNLDLVEELYYFEGLELVNYDIDVLLAPGVNIHRHPLNGRNFEYFSEDPLVTGLFASAVVRGLNKAGVHGSIKHFAANNQETDRTFVDAVVSERALREIYLKGFEIAIKESKASVIMTSYNPINSIWAASNYDLNTTILRNEWGFEGIVMTDWWAQMNSVVDTAPSKEKIAEMVIAQNDLYMVVPNAIEYKNNVLQSFNDGLITLSELQRSAKNILSFILKTHSFTRKHNLKHNVINNDIDLLLDIKTNNENIPYLESNDINKYVTMYEKEFDSTNNVSFSLVETKENVTYAVTKEGRLYKFGLTPPKATTNQFEELSKLDIKEYYVVGNKAWNSVSIDLNKPIYTNSDTISFNSIEKNTIYSYPVEITSDGKYIICIKVSSKESNVSQMPFSIYINDEIKQTVTSNGTNGVEVGLGSQILINKGKHVLSIKFHKTGLNVHELSVTKHG